MIYVCIPVKDEKEGIEIVEEVVGSVCWDSRTEILKAYLTTDKNPIYITKENPVSLYEASKQKPQANNKFEYPTSCQYCNSEKISASDECEKELCFYCGSCSQNFSIEKTEKEQSNEPKR